MKSHQTTDEQFGPVFGGFAQCLVEEKSVANWPIEYTVKNVRKSFTLKKRIRGYSIKIRLENYSQLSFETS